MYTGVALGLVAPGFVVSVASPASAACSVGSTSGQISSGRHSLACWPIIVCGVQPVEAFVLGVGKPVAERGVHIGDDARNLVCDGVQETLAFAQGRLGRLALGDVDHRGVAAQDSAPGHRERPTTTAAPGKWFRRGARMSYSALSSRLRAISRCSRSSSRLRVLRKNEVPEALVAHHLFPLVAQPAQFDVVDRDVDAVDVQRVVAAGGLVVEVLRQRQRLAELAGWLADTCISAARRSEMSSIWMKMPCVSPFSMSGVYSTVA